MGAGDYRSVEGRTESMVALRCSTEWLTDSGLGLDQEETHISTWNSLVVDRSLQGRRGRLLSGSLCQIPEREAVLTSLVS